MVGSCSSALLLSTILHELGDLGINEVHITRHGDLTRVRYRIDGLLRTAHVMPVTRHAGLIARLKAASADRNLQLETFPSLDGEHAILRVPHDVADNLEALGFDGEESAAVNKIIYGGRGIIAVVGPPGSGCSTTLKTLARLAEDGGSRYRQVDEAPRSCCDLNAALYEALAGRTVGFETCDDRLVESSLRDEDMAHIWPAVPSAVIHQRLLRRVCTDCSDDSAAQPCEDFCGQGCERCRGTGYFGQVLAPVVQPLDSYFSSGDARVALRERALRLVQDRLTTLEEVNRLRL